MFDETPFHSWSFILAGAALFALLFSIAAVLVAYLADGTLQLTGEALVLGLAAFVGYIVVALVLRRQGPEA